MWRRSTAVAASRFLPWHLPRIRNRVLSRRRLSDKVPNDDASPEECARSLSWMTQVLASESSIATEWAKTLSPQARAELSKIRRLSTRSESHVPEPPMRELQLVALNQLIPFVGFGIMDNALLIVAGDAIDTSLGVTLGISTMCAAAIGNIISDVAGVMLGTIIEDFSARLGLPVPNISVAQRQLRSVRFAGQFGICLGLVIGCTIGMFPLLLIDSNKVQRMKEEAHMDSIFHDIMTETKDLIGAEWTRLFLVVDTPTSTKPSRRSEDKDQYLYGKFIHGREKDQFVHPVSIGKGIVSRAVLTGEAVNIYDAQTEPDFSKEISDDQIRQEIKNMACVPVFDSQGRVIAVIQAINKIRKGVLRETDAPTRSSGGGFTTSDIQVLKVLASHVSVALQVMFEEESELSLRDTIRTLKEHGIAGLGEDQTAQDYVKPRPLFPDSIRTA